MPLVRPLSQERLQRRTTLTADQIEWLQGKAEQQVDGYILDEAPPIVGVLTSVYAAMLSGAAADMPARVLRQLVSDNAEDLLDLARRHAERLERERASRFTGEAYDNGAVVEVKR